MYQLFIADDIEPPKSWKINFLILCAQDCGTSYGHVR